MNDGKTRRAGSRAHRHRVTELMLLVAALALLTWTSGQQTAGAAASVPGDQAVVEEPSCPAQQDQTGPRPTGPQPRSRPPQIVHKVGETFAASARVGGGPYGESAERDLAWWPYELKPPFGRLSAEERGEAAAIVVGNTSFLVHRGAPPIPAQLTDARPAAEGGGYYIAHLTAPLGVDAVKRLRSAGVDPIRYVPRSGYLMRIPAGGVPALTGAAAVDGLYRYQPAWKISPLIGKRPVSAPAAARRAPEALHLRLSVFPGEDPSAVARRAGELGAEVLRMTAAAPRDPGLLPDGRERAHRPSYVDVAVPAPLAAEIIPGWRGSSRCAGSRRSASTLFSRTGR